MLPISYGWGGYPEITVECGRCKRSVIVAEVKDGVLIQYDDDWDSRYQRSHGYSPFAQERKSAANR